jgi:hypothetical protein
MTSVTSQGRGEAVGSRFPLDRSKADEPLEHTLQRITNADPFSPALILSSLRSMGRHTEADLIEGQHDRIKELEAQIKRSRQLRISKINKKR